MYNEVKANQNQTIKALKRVEEKVIKLYEVCNKYTDEIEKVENGLYYTEKGLQAVIDQYSEKLKSEVESFKTNTNEDLEYAYRVEVLNNGITPINDQDLNSALNIINHMGKNIDSAVKDGIIKRYKGCYQSQVILERMFENVGVECDKFVVDIANSIKRLMDHLKFGAVLLPNEVKEKMTVAMLCLNLIYDELCVPEDKFIVLPTGEHEIKFIDKAQKIVYEMGTDLGDKSFF